MRYIRYIPLFMLFLTACDTGSTFSFAGQASMKEKLTRLDGVASIESSFALGQVKNAQALPIAS